MGQWQLGDAEEPLDGISAPRDCRRAETLRVCRIRTANGPKASLPANRRTLALPEAAAGEPAAMGSGKDRMGGPRRPRPPRVPIPAGTKSGPAEMKTAQIVIEEIRRVAKERANGMTLDSPIAESGMDSLERMEILATLEERFGGRFPPEILPELETTRHVIAAVKSIWADEPRTTATAQRPRKFRPKPTASTSSPNISNFASD